MIQIDYKNIHPLSDSELEEMFSQPHTIELLHTSASMISDMHPQTKETIITQFKKSFQFIWNDLSKYTTTFHDEKLLGDFITFTVRYSCLKLVLAFTLNSPEIPLPIIIPKEIVKKAITKVEQPKYCNYDVNVIIDMFTSDITSVSQDISNNNLTIEALYLEIVMKFIEDYSNFKFSIITCRGTQFNAQLFS
jgi:hypothetical protein